MIFLSSADNFQHNFFQNIFSGNNLRESNRLDSDQAQHFVRPNVDPNYLQRSSAEASKERVKPVMQHSNALAFVTRRQIA